MMMISRGTFFSEVLSSCFIWKGNNTFDGKIIVTWREPKLHGDARCTRVITFMTYGADWCTWVRGGEKCWLLWTNVCFWSCFISSEREQVIFLSDVPSSLLVFDFFGMFVTLWWWRDVRWVLYYFCTFVYKPVKKSLNSKFCVWIRFFELLLLPWVFLSPPPHAPPHPPSWGPTQIPILSLLSFIWLHPFTAGIKGPTALWVGLV